MAPALPRTDHDIAIVEWHDARVLSNTDYFKKDDPDLDLAIMVSVGHVVREDAELIALAMDYATLKDGVEHPYRIVGVIPKACIKRIQRVVVMMGEG